MSAAPSQGDPPGLAPAWPPGLRRRIVSILIGPFDGGAPAEARLQPGAEAFPKRAFELGRDEPRAPEGQSLAYLRLLRRLWLEAWTREANSAVSPREAWLRRVHAAVLRAHELERELLDRLEARL